MASEISADSKIDTGGCPRCRHPYEAGRKFCVRCGATLSDTCPECDRDVAVNENFCGHCGAHIQATVEKQRRHIEAIWAESRQLQKEHRHDEALGLLRAVADTRNARLTEHAARTNALIKQLVMERERRCESARQAYAIAKQHFAQRSYAAAESVLMKIPAPFRDEQSLGLLDDVRSAMETLRSLRRDIQTALRTKRTANLLPKVERFLSLNPTDRQAFQLARKLSHVHCQEAKKRLEQHEYGQALELLSQIPESFRDSDAGRLMRRAAELRHLMVELRSAPYANRSLLAIAQRLVKLDPQNRAGCELAEKLQRCLAACNGSAVVAPPAWSPAPEQTHVGVPVDVLGRYRHLDDAKVLDSPCYAADPGQFAVACGLALQGLQKAAIRTNLLPRERKGLRGRLGEIAERMRKRQPVRCAWGIDMGASSIKAVRLDCDEDGQTIRFTDCDLVDVGNPTEAASEEHQRANPRNALETFLSRNDVNAAQIVVGMPGTQILGRYFCLPPVDPKKLEAVVHYEMKQQIPFPDSELVWDYHASTISQQDGAADRNGAENEANGNKQLRIVLLAAKLRDVEDVLAPFHELELRVDALQCDCMALHNLAIVEMADRGLPVALVDVGHATTNLIVSTADTAWFRSVGRGNHDVTGALVRELKLTHAAAKALARDPSHARSLSEVAEVVQPAFENLAKEIRLSLASFQKMHPHLVPHGLWGVGGGFRTHGLLRYLRSGQ